MEVAVVTMMALVEMGLVEVTLVGARRTLAGGLLGHDGQGGGDGDGADQGDAANRLALHVLLLPGMRGVSRSVTLCIQRSGAMVDRAPVKCRRVVVRICKRVSARVGAPVAARAPRRAGRGWRA